MTNDDVKIIQKELVYDGYFKMTKFHLQHRLFVGGWSAVINREVFERGDAVCVLLYDPKEDKVVLLEQFRVGALDREFDPWLFEIVAGVREPGESDLTVAMRETEEEAGVRISEAHYMCDFLSSPGGMSERVYLYYSLVDASKLSGIYGVSAEHEDIKVHVVPRRTAYQWVKTGKIKNAMTIIAIQWLQLNRRAFKTW